MLISGSKGLTRLAGLLLLLLLLGLAGCATAEEVAVIPTAVGDDAQVEEADGAPTAEVEDDGRIYPCSPYFLGVDEDAKHSPVFKPRFHDFLLEWTPNGAQILFGVFEFRRAHEIRVVNAQGSRLRTLVDPARGNPAYGFHFDVSPDSTQVVYSSCEFQMEGSAGIESLPERGRYHYEIAVINLDGTGRKRLTANAYLDHYPAWSPDGSRIAFIAAPSDCIEKPTERNLVLYTMAADGSDVQQLAPPVPGIVVFAPPFWSPTGEHVAFLVREVRQGPVHFALYTIRTDGSELTRIARIARASRVVPVPRDVPPLVALPSWSADGAYLAFLAQEEGRNFSISIARADGTELRQALVLPESDLNLKPHRLLWSPDGEHLALVMADEQVALAEQFEFFGVPIMLEESGRIYISRVDGTGQTQILPAHGPGWNPSLVSWSPDGSELLFVSRQRVFLIRPDGGELRRLGVGPQHLFSAFEGGLWRSVAWSPDGARIALYDGASPYVKHHGIFTVALDRTDTRGLVWGYVDPSVEPWHLPQPDKPVDPAVCSAGVTVPQPRANPGLVADYKTLLGLRDALAGRATLNWNGQTRIAEWEGIATDGLPRRVTTLRLDDRGLTGMLPPELGQLTALRVLNLSTSYGIKQEVPNRLHGSLPPELGNLSYLHTLLLSGNHLSGEIPRELGNLTNLRNLKLDRNYLRGGIPPELGGLAELGTLDLSANGLSGSLPKALGNLPSLWSLNLSNNELSGPIPAELGGITNLNQLEFGSNELSGPIPPELGNLTNLTTLNLSNNELNGPIPPELGDLNNLLVLNLSNNELSGPIPPELGTLARLQRLDLGSNTLRGPIPPELYYLTNLLYLALRDNALTGAIPPGLGNLAGLQVLFLGKNILSGPIPPEWGGLFSLYFLDLSFTELMGSLPPELGQLAYIEKLNLTSTKLSGCVPTESVGDYG